MFRKYLVAVYAASLWLFACTGGSGGLDGSKDLGSLSESELIAFCEYSESLSNSSDFSELSCYDDAFNGVEQGGDCETLFAECMAVAEPADLECGQNETDPYPICASLVTVAEMQTCLADRVGIVNGRGITCASTPEDIDAIFDELVNGPLPASCVSIEEKCPGLVGA